ncbi:MAG: YitT family protein [Tissierellia bacterium]|nr:YitT family protein [Tissierellia bacterium]
MGKVVLRDFIGSKEDFIVKLPITIIGTIFMTIGINMFYLPMEILAAGVGGIGMILEYQLGIPTGVTMFLLNVPLFILAYFKLSKEFTFYTMLSSVLFSIGLIITRPYSNILQMDDMLLAAIFGGVFSGIGGGLLFRFGTSSGGLDILATFFKKAYNINVGSMLMAVNVVIVAIGAFSFGIEKAMYTVISLFVTYKIVDRIQLGFGEKKHIFIMTKHHEIIAQEIMDKVIRGVTFLDGQGAYSKDKMKIVYTVVNTRQIVKIKEIIKEHDPSAFMSISEVTEVKGEGFRTYNV